MKTLIIYSNFQDLPKFAIVDGDHYPLNGVVIGTCLPDNDKEDLTDEEQEELEVEHEEKQDLLSELLEVNRRNFSNYFPSLVDVSAVINVGEII